MRPLVRHTQRLQRLAVFEAAARLGSFSAAGRELAMAQPAVTRQVRALEVALDVELFRRSANRVELTEAGRRFADTLDVAFSAIEHAIDEVTELDATFVLATSPGFAQQLIVPALDSLQHALGDRDLRLWLYDTERELTEGTFDAAVRLSSTGSGWPGHQHRELFAEHVVPVASPSLADELGLNASSSATDVLAAPLLHMDARDRPWMSWAEWLAASDLALTPGRRRVVFNNYPTVLQQAVAGRGVALGWIGLVDGLVADGLLRPVGPQVSSARSYCVTWPERRSSSAVSAVVAWLESYTRSAGEAASEPSTRDPTQSMP